MTKDQLTAKLADVTAELPLAIASVHRLEGAAAMLRHLLAEEESPRDPAV